MTDKPPPMHDIADAFGGGTLRDWFAGNALIMLPHMGCGADLDTYDTNVDWPAEWELKR